MLLTIDIGNTNVVFAFYREGVQVDMFRAESNRNKTADEYGLLLRQFFLATGHCFQEVEGIAMASVVPSLTKTFDELCQKYLRQEPLIVTYATDTGMPILMDEPTQVGADRIVNGVAGFAKYGGPLIVLDFGTATTFDCVSAKGEYLGGAIAPGLHLSAEALFSGTAKLPMVSLTAPDRAIGKNTDECIRSGVVLGCAYMVDSLIEQIWRELGGTCTVVATGGLASQMATVCHHIDQVDTSLTMEGLYLIWQKINKPML